MSQHIDVVDICVVCCPSRAHRPGPSPGPRCVHDPASLPLATAQLQRLYRLLHEMLLAAGRSEEAGLVMVELLGTFTTEDANQAKEEAGRCVVASLADPNTRTIS